AARPLRGPPAPPPTVRTPSGPRPRGDGWPARRPARPAPPPESVAGLGAARCAGSYPHQLAQAAEHLLADPGYGEHIVDAREAAVLLPPRDDAPGQRGADPGQRLQRRGIR